MQAIKILVIICLSLLSKNIFAADPALQFPDWRLNQASDQVKQFQKETGELTPEEVNRARDRAEEAMNHKEWAKAANEFARVLGSKPTEREAWAQLSLALQQENKERQNWKTLEDAKLAALNLYLISKTPEEQAEALFIYGNTIGVEEDESPSYSTLYESIHALTDVTKLKEKKPELSNMMRFQYYKMQVNNQASPPSVCFSFTHPLASRNVKPEDYLILKPKIQAAVKIVGRDICVSPLQFGANYEVTLKSGLKDNYDEKLPENVQLSFKVKDRPSLLSFKTNAYVLPKNEKALVPLSGVNVDDVSIKILRINDRTLNQTVGQDKDFLMRLWQYSIDQIKDKRGELLYEGKMNFTNQKNETVTKLIPVSDLIKKTEPGVYIIQAEEKGSVLGNVAAATQWMIVSDMGLTTLTQSDGGLMVNVRSLQTANPLSNIEVKLLSYNNSILKTLTTNKDGMVFFEPTVTQGKGGNRPLLVLAYAPKGDFSFLSLEQMAFDLSDRGVSGRKLPPTLDAFLYTEQGVYRPSDTVHINALLRDQKRNATPNLPLTFKIFRSDDVLVSEQTRTGNDLGFYELSLPLLNTSRTGTWKVLAYLDPKKEAIGRVQFSVEDFVPSRITIQLTTPTKQLKFNEAEPLNITANYLFGAPAANLRGEGFISLRARPTPFPKWSDYQFGLINDPFKDSKIPLSFEPLNQEGKGETKLLLNKLPETTKPLEAVIRVTLADKGGRPEIGTLTLPVQTASFMIGIKPKFSKNLLPETVEKASFDVITINPEQMITASPNLEFELYEEQPHYTWYQTDRSSPWQYQIRLEDKFLSRGTLSTQAGSPTELNIPIANWGQYRLEIRDPKTQVASSLRFNKGFEMSSESTESPDKITIRANQSIIGIDGSVELYIEAPFEGQALLSIANQKILETRNINVSPKGTRIKFNATEDWESGVYCLVSAFRPLTEKSETSKPFLPKRGVGLVWVGIDPKPRTLALQFELPTEVKPRQTIQIPFTVTQNNKPISGPTQVSLAAVDEGILKLTEFQTPKPEVYFFGKHRLAVELRDLYGKLIDPLKGTLGELHVGGDAGLFSRNLQALSKRSFKVVSLYQGLVPVDKSGKGQISLTLPDFNGRLRLMAVAFNDKNLGSTEADLLVRDPIVLEAVLPRFLAPGDHSQVSLSLTNISAPAGEYELQWVTTGPLKVQNEKNKKIVLKDNDKLEFTVPMEAEKLGDASIKLKLIGKGLTIERLFDISIRPAKPYQLESQTQILKPSEQIVLNDTLLKSFEPDSILANLSFSANVPWDTQSILKRLRDYPYGCIEQLTSKGVGALYGGTEEDKSRLSDVIASLSEKQYGPGYYTFWDSTENGGDLFLTAYAMDLLLRAKAQGVPIPTFTLERGLRWLSQSVERSEYNSYTLTELSYVLYVLTKANQLETGNLRYFFDTYLNNFQNPIARAFIGTALSLRGDVGRAKEAFQNSLEFFNTSYDSPYGTYLRDRLMVLCLMRESLSNAPAMNELTDTMNQLLSLLQNELQKEVKMSQLSTQELAWAVLAAQSLGQGQTNTIDLQLADKPLHADNNLNEPFNPADLIKGLSLKNTGKNAVWQTLMVSGIPKDVPKAESSGVDIKRRYYTLEGTERDLNKIPQGTPLVVVLEGTVSEPHLLLAVDFLPAGFEIENSRLGQLGMSDIPWLGELTKAEHIEFRDDRFVASISLDEKKSFRLAYVVRAVTPGNYHYPGLFVEDMYAPSFFARTDAEKVEIVSP